MNTNNNAIVIGYLPEKPAIQKTKNGKSYIEFEIPARDNYKQPDGTYPTDWVHIRAFGNNAEYVAKCNKGDLIAVGGAIKVDRWKGDNNRTHERVYVRCEQITRLAKSTRQVDESTSFDTGNVVADITNDDLPF